MQCCLLNDESRECENKFSFLVQDVSYDFCKSEDFKICPFYKIIVNNKTFCENIEDCGFHFHRLNSVIHHNTNTFKKIKNLIFDYCLSENKEECARLKLKNKEKTVPKTLLQDGTKLKTYEILPKNTYH